MLLDFCYTEIVINFVKNIEIPEYVFNLADNPYKFNAKNPKSISEIAEKIEEAIKSSFDTNHVLVRGIQSGHHQKIDRDDLIALIQKNGQDTYDKDLYESDTIHATLFSENIIKNILMAFHVYKPKCEECPQYPVDIWMIFDASAYKNIEYMHPRHKVLARDKWELASINKSGLRGILVIN